MQFPTTNSGVSLVIDLEFIAKVEFLMNDFTKVKTIIMMASIIIRLYQQNSTVASGRYLYMLLGNLGSPKKT